MRNCKMILRAVMAAVLSGMTILSSSCDPDCEPCKESESWQPAVLELSLSSASVRSTEVQSLAQDNTVNTIDVFIFRNTETTSADYQRLDTYKRFQGNGLDKISIETTTGPKTICVIVNSDVDTYVGITDLTEFRAMKALLSEETLGDFTMYGEASCRMDVQTSISISVSRLIAKVEINSIKTRFAGTPYQGMTLSNCKLYLINVHGDKLLSSGGSTAAPVILNDKTLVAEDVNNTAEPGLIMDHVSGTIGDAGYTTAHTFYCYSNETSDIPSATKLVLQADLDGVTYYYPLPVNQAGYRLEEDDSNDSHYGIRSNVHYSYGMVISRPGTLNPNEPLLPGTLEISMTVDNWDVIPYFIKEY